MCVSVRSWIVGVIMLSASVPFFASAESSSPSYIMWADATTSGGNRATSTNYIVQEATGDRSGNQGESTSYKTFNGFEEVYEEPILILSLDDVSMPLSPSALTTGTVSTASMTASVTTNADFGYTLAMTEIQEIQNATFDTIDDVGDGSVTAGSEEFGVAVSGADAAFATDQAVSATPLILASRTIWGTGRDTTITFKAAIDTLTVAGSYTGLYRIIATSNF
ncbi:hypothetical protein HYV73_03310 [Candidatus Uhrbacteria bacterium]|nr:hypothetical protein [Candidatus Uhrbacteria bacterium]